MLDEKNMDRTDAMGRQFGEMKEQLLPPPALEKAVIKGVPYGKPVRTRVHVIRITKAVAAYVVGIALFLGMLVMLPGLFEGGDPIDPAGTNLSTSTEAVGDTTTSNPLQTTFVVPPIINYPDLGIPNVAPRDYESVGSPDPGTMSAAKEKEIKAAKAAKYGVTLDDVYVKFYANINEKYAVKIEVAGYEHGALYTVETVYGLRFASGNTNTMKIYTGGRFYSIPEAFTMGILSAREVQELYVITHYAETTPAIREQCAARYGGDPDDYFIRVMASGSHDNGETMWCLVYLYGDSIEVQSEPSSETVNGMKFCYPDSRKMEIYYEGKFYTMAEALDQGIISDWNVEECHYEHLERSAREPLTDAMEAEIQAAWQAEFGSALTWQKDGGSVRCYGSYSDRVVLFAEGEEEGEFELNVAGFRYKHTSAFEIYVYADGEFVDLEAAYANGLIDVNVLNFVGGVHHDYQKSLTQ